MSLIIGPEIGCTLLCIESRDYPMNDVVYGEAYAVA